MKYRFPKCNSSNIEYWRKSVCEDRYKLDSNGIPSLTPSASILTRISGMHGLICENCGNTINLANEDYKDWEERNENI